jgi:hypothetical protein
MIALTIEEGVNELNETYMLINDLTLALRTCYSNHLTSFPLQYREEIQRSSIDYRNIAARLREYATAFKLTLRALKVVKGAAFATFGDTDSTVNNNDTDDQDNPSRIRVSPKFFEFPVTLPIDYGIRDGSRDSDSRGSLQAHM